jgi:hypothetical protein
MLNRRKKYWIDFPVQGALVRRLVFHWLVFFALCVTLLPIWRLMSGAELSGPYVSLLQLAWAEAGPVFLLMLLLLPLFVWDTVKLSNRFAGPMYRLRKSLAALAAGENVPPVRLRDGDFWQEVAHDFNIVMHRLKSAEAEQPEPRAGLRPFDLEPVGSTGANDADKL